MQTNEKAVAPRVDRVVRPLTLQDCEHLFWLAARDYVFFSTFNDDKHTWDGGWYSCVLCNDTFYYACADATRLNPQEAEEVRNAVERFGWAGAVAWCALKRDEEPLEPLRTEQYRAALEALRPNAELSR